MKKPRQPRLFPMRGRPKLEKGWGYCYRCGAPTMHYTQAASGKVFACYKHQKGEP